MIAVAITPHRWDCRPTHAELRADLLGFDDAAHFFRISVYDLRILVLKHRDIPRYRLGQETYFFRSELNMWIDENYTSRAAT